MKRKLKSNMLEKIVPELGASQRKTKDFNCHNKLNLRI